jgi:hypothetical protein
MESHPSPITEISGGGVKYNAPAPPMLFGGGDASGFCFGRKDLSLADCQPDSLGINYERRRRKAGGDSPVTPWPARSAC